MRPLFGGSTVIGCGPIIAGARTAPLFYKPDLICPSSQVVSQPLGANCLRQNEVPYCLPIIIINYRASLSFKGHNTLWWTRFFFVLLENSSTS